MKKKNRIKNFLEDWKFLYDGSLLGFSPKTFFLALKQFYKSEKLTIFDGQIVVNHAMPRFPSKYVSNYLLYLKKIRKKDNWPPLNFFLSVTDRCPSNCIYCYNDCSKKSNSQSELSLKQIKEILEYFKKNEPTMFQCCITGGETMLRKDIVEIVREASKDFFTFLNTSGIGFTEEKAAALKEAGLGIFKVSLDHFDRDFINERRGHPMAFDSAVNAIKIGVRSGLYTSVGAVASRRLLSKDDFFSFVEFLEKLGANDLRLYSYKQSGKGVAGEFFTKEEEDRLGEYQMIVNKNRRLKIKMMSMPFLESPSLFGCNAGSRHFCFAADGTVSPCPYLTIPVGNINHEPIGKILSRLKECLPEPHRFCATNYLLSKGFDLNELWKKNDIEKNCGILKNIPKTKLPDIYKKF